MTKEELNQLKEFGIDIRRITKQHQENFLHKSNNLALLVTDQSSYLNVESHDDTKEETAEEETAEEETVDLATYSNSEATVFAYISIFENLWMQAQV